jgi:hypothetical protein
MVYEGRETILEQFPLLRELKKSIPSKPQQSVKMQKSLF